MIEADDGVDVIRIEPVTAEITPAIPKLRRADQVRPARSHETWIVVVWATAVTEGKRIAALDGLNPRERVAAEHPILPTTGGPALAFAGRQFVVHSTHKAVCTVIAGARFLE